MIYTLGMVISIKQISSPRQTGSIILFSENSGILETFTTASITDNVLSIDITGMITEIDDYKIIVSDGFITSDFGTFENGTYDFKVAAAEFDNTEFNNNFLI